MVPRNFIIATAGHVDHGKSALVKALTGTDPDRLPEEKARGITIDLGFAELSLTAPNGDPLHAGIIDVPGHEGFVRNMIAGLGSIDLALLIVASDDGWMPQTEEHLQILFYLGISKAVIALTKTDLGQVEKTSSQVRDRLRHTEFAQAPIIPTSTRTNNGIAELKTALASALSNVQPQHDIGKPRLFVDRAFTLRGIGTVVTGTLGGGTLRRGQEVIVQPRKLPARIRSLQNHGRDSELAMPGMRTALNLPDLAVGETAMAIARGDVVSTADLEAGATLDVLLEKSPRLREKDPAVRPLKSGTSVYLHHGTARVASKLVLLDDDSLERGQCKIAELRLDSPVFAFLGDRFVIRDRSEQQTIAGGIVLDPNGDRKSFRSAAQRDLLTARAKAPNSVDVCVASEVRRRGPIESSAVLQKSHFSAAEIAAALQRLRDRGELLVRDEIVADAQSWQTLRGRAIKAIDDTHERNSQLAGLDIAELRNILHDQPPKVFESLLADLCRDGFVRNGSFIARTSHRATLPSHLEPIAEEILAALAKTPSDPPSRKELVPTQAAHQTLSFLIQQGRVVEISPELILLRDQFEKMKTAIANFLSQHGEATVSELRQELKTSRRVMVPLLEKLDRYGITRRVGDKRVLI